jgi:hypothetical protein
MKLDKTKKGQGVQRNSHMYAFAVLCAVIAQRLATSKEAYDSDSSGAKGARQILEEYAARGEKSAESTPEWEEIETTGTFYERNDWVNPNMTWYRYKDENGRVWQRDKETGETTELGQ